MMRASFHFPLHRYLAAFTCQAVSKMNMTLKDIIPPPDLLTLLMIHPLRVQVMHKLFLQTHHFYLFVCSCVHKRVVAIVHNLLLLSRPPYFPSDLTSYRLIEILCNSDCNRLFRNVTVPKKN